MEKDKPFKILIILQLTIISILALYIIYDYVAFNQQTETIIAPLEGQTGLYPFIGNNTLIAQANVFYPKPKVYASLGGKYNELIEDVIQCESGWDNSKRGKAGEIGLCQFMPKTWEYFNKLRGTNLDIYNEEHQLEMIYWAFDNNLQNHWTCYRILTNKIIQ